jgi:hypothetical protein
MIPALGHVLGLPVEEMIAPLVPVAFALIVAARLSLSRLLHRRD